MPAEKVYLLDATSICYRSFFAIKLSTSSGFSTGGIYGFYNTVKKIVQGYRPVYMGACFDVSRKTFRQEKFKEYKIQRPPVPDDLKAQIPLVKKMTGLMGIPRLEKEGYEADDLIAVLTLRARARGHAVVIVTSDKDMSQLLEDDKVTIYNPAKDKMITEKTFTDEYGFKPARMVDYLALTGDASDNIPGARGIGKVGASRLIKEYGTIENIFKDITGVPPKTAALLAASRENIFLSKELIALGEHPLDFTVDDLKVGPVDQGGLNAMFRELEFKSLVKDTLVQAPEPPPQTIAADASQLSAAARKGLIFTIKNGRAFVLAGKDRVLEAGCEAIKDLLADSRCKKISYDIKGQMLEGDIGDIAGECFDVKIAAYLIDATAGEYTLEALAQNYLNRMLAADSPTAALAAIARLRDIFAPRLKREGMQELFDKVEMPLVMVLKDMQAAGVKIDTEAMESFLEDVDKELKKVSAGIYKAAGKEFNLNSPKQLREVLFTELKIRPTKKTKTGYSTNEEVLSELAREHRIAALLLDYRQLTKLRGTYILPLLEAVKAGDGRLHASFNQASAQTGRLSSSNPNLQSIPAKGDLAKNLRRSFVPSFEGGCFIAGDYSQIELRILAHYSQDENLLEAFKGRSDIHAYTASLLFRDQDLGETNKRDIAKRVNFAVLYGMGAYSLARELGVSLARAQSFIDDYFLRYHKVKDYMQNVYKELEEKGYVTTVLGRKRRLPDFNSPNHQLREFARRQAVNTPIQGSCADLIKTAMVGLYKELKAKKMLSRIIIQIHDELVLDVAPDEPAAVIEMLRRNMLNSLKLAVPVEVNIKRGPNWADMEEVA